MSRVELIAPCHFGLESVLKKEILDLGYEIVQVEDGRITFAGDESAIASSNVAASRPPHLTSCSREQRPSPGRSI